MRRLLPHALAVLPPTLVLGCGETAAPRARLALSPPSIALLVCQEVALTSTVTPQRAGVVLYRSDNEAVATISPAGHVAWPISHPGAIATDG